MDFVDLSSGRDAPSYGTLEIHRTENKSRDLIRAYRVVVDDVVCTKIKRSQTRTIRLDPGSHTVELRLDWGRSRKIKVDIASGATVRMICEPGGSGREAIRDSVGPSGYIKLAVNPER